MLFVCSQTVYCLLLDVKSVAFMLHHNNTVAALVFCAIKEGINGQAGILVIQPIRTHVVDCVVQRSNGVNNQLLVANHLSNIFI